MKNTKIYIMLAVAVMLGAASFVSAEDVSGQTGGVRQEVRDIKANAASQIKDIRAEARDEIQTTMVNAVKQRVENRYGKISNRFQATIDRLNNIIGRIETRIAKMKALGGDTTIAQKAVDDAKKYIAEAQTAMATLQSTTTQADDTYTNASTTKEFKTILTNLKKSSDSIQKLLKQAHTSLTKSIGTLKGLKVGEASTTPSN